MCDAYCVYLCFFFVNSVPRSPDLTDHARSLRGTVLHSPVIDPRRLSLASDPGDLCLEDTGSIGISKYMQ